MSSVIVITGISGFLGSHMAERLCVNNKVIGLYRSSSDLWRCDEIANKNLTLINTDENGWEETAGNFKPSILIHSAWGGVAVDNRSDWETQAESINYAVRILSLAKKWKVKKFIGLGSQAEYGYYDKIIDEKHPCNPVSAYGACKLAAMQLVKSFSTAHKINWFWLRLFPLYGKREDISWFIPMVIQHALTDKELDLTGCNQHYAYLHVSDFCRLIEKIAAGKDEASGIYNVSSDKSISLRHVVETIAALSSTKAKFNFGALPYRDNQAMLMQGNAQLLYNTFQFKPEIIFENSIAELIEYYKWKYNSK